MPFVKIYTDEERMQKAGIGVFAKESAQATLSAAAAAITAQVAQSGLLDEPLQNNLIGPVSPLILNKINKLPYIKR